jgi:two-component system, OmpR family, KDP operon response regulator KdpE
MASLLIVEDEDNIRKFVATNLVARGFQVVEAGDAETGLDQLRKSPPDVLVLDIRLPGMSGWDLLEIMKAEEVVLSKVPVIVMTASVTNTKFQSGNYPNVSAWLVKPVSVHELIRAVKNALNHGDDSVGEILG